MLKNIATTLRQLDEDEGKDKDEDKKKDEDRLRLASGQLLVPFKVLSYFSALALRPIKRNKMNSSLTLNLNLNFNLISF